MDVNDEHQRWLDEIRLDPQNDTLRLVYADWLEERGDARGEFIRLQCELAQEELDEDRRVDLTLREHALLSRHERDWTGVLAEFTAKCVFRRGMVEYAALMAKAFLARGDELFTHSQVHSATIHIEHREELWELAECPLLAKLTGLRLEGDGVDDDGMRRFLRSPHLSGLDRILLDRLGLGEATGEALGEAPALSRLKMLDLSRNLLRNVGATAIVRSPTMANLEVLMLGANEVRLLGARAIAQSPYLERLNYLDVRQNPIPERGIRLLIDRFGRDACYV